MIGNKNPAELRRVVFYRISDCHIPQVALNAALCQEVRRSERYILRKLLIFDACMMHEYFASTAQDWQSCGVVEAMSLCDKVIWETGHS